MLFQIGKVSVGKDVLESNITPSELILAFGRYLRGDWGEIDGQEDLTNDLAITDGSRIIAVYRSCEGICFRIETEAGQTWISLVGDPLLSVTA